MARRWKRIAMGSVQVMAQCKDSKRGSLMPGNAGANGSALLPVPGITGRRQHGEGKAAPAVSALVMRCLKGGGA